MSTLNKVTAFVTRGDSYLRELLVLSNSTTGALVPAGTAEPGETPQAAVLREVAERTGLRDVTIRALLSALDQPLMPRQRVLLRTVQLQNDPAADAPPLDFTLRRGMSVNLLETRTDYARVLYEEEKYDGSTKEFTVTAQQAGWIPTDSLTSYVQRYLFHLRPTGETPDRWTVRLGDMDYELYWVSLLQDPDLVSGHDVWLGCVFDQLKA